jgi:hypothetical protein
LSKALDPSVLAQPLTFSSDFSALIAARLLCRSITDCCVGFSKQNWYGVEEVVRGTAHDTAEARASRALRTNSIPKPKN